MKKKKTVVNKTVLKHVNALGVTGVLFRSASPISLYF